MHCAHYYVLTPLKSQPKVDQRIKPGMCVCVCVCGGGGGDRSFEECSTSFQPYDFMTSRILSHRHDIDVLFSLISIVTNTAWNSIIYFAALNQLLFKISRCVGFSVTIDYCSRKTGNKNRGRKRVRKGDLILPYSKVQQFRIKREKLFAGNHR